VLYMYNSSNSSNDIAYGPFGSVKDTRNLFIPAYYGKVLKASGLDVIENNTVGILLVIDKKNGHVTKRHITQLDTKFTDHPSYMFVRTGYVLHVYDTAGRSLLDNFADNEYPETTFVKDSTNLIFSFIKLPISRTNDIQIMITQMQQAPAPASAPAPAPAPAPVDPRAVAPRIQSLFIESTYSERIMIRWRILNIYSKPVKVEMYVNNVHIKGEDVVLNSADLKSTIQQTIDDSQQTIYESIKSIVFKHPSGTFSNTFIRVFNEHGLWTDSPMQTLYVFISESTCTENEEYYKDAGICRPKCKTGEYRLYTGACMQLETTANCEMDKLSLYGACKVTLPRLKVVALPTDPGYRHLKSIRNQDRVVAGASNQNASAMFYKNVQMGAPTHVTVQVVMSDGTNRWLRFDDKEPVIHYSNTFVENVIPPVGAYSPHRWLIYEEGKMFDDVTYVCQPMANFKYTQHSDVNLAECVKSNECIPGFEQAELIQNGVSSLRCEPVCEKGTLRFDKTSLACTPCENIGKFVYAKNKTGTCVKTENCVQGYVNVLGSCFEACELTGADLKTFNVKLTPQQTTALKLTADNRSCTSTGVCIPGYYRSGTECVLGSKPIPPDPTVPDWKHLQRQRNKIATIKFDSGGEQTVSQLYTIIQLNAKGPFGVEMFPCDFDMAISDSYVVHLWRYLPDELSQSRFVDQSYTNDVSETPAICQEQTFSQFPSCAQYGYWNSIQVSLRRERSDDRNEPNVYVWKSYPYQFGKQGHHSKYIAVVPIYREAPLPRPLTVPPLATVKTKTGTFNIHHANLIYPMIKKLNGEWFNPNYLNNTFESTFDTVLTLQPGFVINLWYSIHLSFSNFSMFEKEEQLTIENYRQNNRFHKLFGYGLMDMRAYLENVKDVPVLIGGFERYNFIHMSIEPFKLADSTVAVQLGQHFQQFDASQLDKPFPLFTVPHTNSTVRFNLGFAVAKGYEIEFTQHKYVIKEKYYKGFDYIFRQITATYLLVEGTGTPMTYTRENASQAVFTYRGGREIPFEKSNFHPVYDTNPRMFFTIRKRIGNSTTFVRLKEEEVIGQRN